MATTEVKLSKDQITNALLEHLDVYYEIYGINGSGELTIYDYPFSENIEDESVNIEIMCDHGVFLRGTKGLKKISGIIHETFNDKEFKKKHNISLDRMLSRNWELDIINSLKYRRTVDIEAFDKLISGKETILFLNGKILVKFPLQPASPFFPPNNNAYKSFQQLPIKYDKTAECPKIDAFLKETFGEERFTFICEIFGYLMSSSILHQKAFIFYGEASTGKTTFLELLTRFIGKRLISNISLHGLGERFALGRTRDKRVNIYDDLNFAKIYNKAYGIFKQLVTNKSLSSEIKFVNDLVDWDNTCKCVFGCNQLPFVPKYADTDFYRRMVIISCRNVVKNKNKNILAELTTEKELSGLLNRALNGLAVLYGEGGFPEEYDNEESVIHHWELNSHPSKMFIEEECRFDEDASIDVDTFNEILRNFRRNKGVSKVTDRQIATSLGVFKKGKKPMIFLRKRSRDGIRYRVYDGIDIDKDSDYYQYKDNIYALYKPEIDPLDKFFPTGKVDMNKILVENPKKVIYDTRGEEINFGVEN